MHDFIAKLKKLKKHIPVVAQPTADNPKCFFVNSHLPNVSFLLRRAPVTDLAHAQRLETEVKDGLILSCKIRRDTNKYRNPSILP